MKITFNKFRQIFWMVVALLFIVLLFLNLWINVFYFYNKTTKSAIFVYRINKITGTTKMKLIAGDEVTPWEKTTILEKKNEKEEK